MNEAYIALIGLAVTLLGVVVGSTWKFASLAATLTQTIQELQKKIERVEHEQSVLDSIPVIAQRLEQHDQVLTKLTSWVPKLDTQLKVHDSQLGSLREMKRVRMPSRPDFGGGENNE